MLSGIDHFLEQHCNTLDADVFSSDALSYPENRTMLETYIGRWSRKLEEYKEKQMILEPAKVPCVNLDQFILSESLPMIHIISEPGNGVHYNYLVFRDGPDEFCFMPARSTFRFPQRLNFYDVQSAEESAIHLLSVEHNCNPWTIIECIRIMKELHK